MKKIICWLRTIKYTFNRFINTGEIIPYVSGHYFVEQKSYIRGNKKYFPLKCEVCGNIDKSWIYINGNHDN